MRILQLLDKSCYLTWKKRHGCFNCGVPREGINMPATGRTYTIEDWNADYPCRICRHLYHCHWRPKKG